MLTTSTIFIVLLHFSESYYPTLLGMTKTQRFTNNAYKRRATSSEVNNLSELQLFKGGGRTLQIVPFFVLVGSVDWYAAWPNWPWPLISNQRCRFSSKPITKSHTHRYHNDAKNDWLFTSEYDLLLASYPKVFSWLPAIHERSLIVLPITADSDKIPHADNVLMIY